jgi:toxin-antitoxin system PIN domain toxin
VIAVDTNILVYAHREDSEWHEPAAQAVAALAEGTAEWAIPWPCLHEFLAIVTHPGIFKTPTPADLAFGQVEAWLESPTVVVLSETDEHFGVLRDTALAARVTGPRLHDARVAALCLGHGVGELWTADRDFSCFSRLRTRNPLVAPKRR